MHIVRSDDRISEVVRLHAQILFQSRFRNDALLALSVDPPRDTQLREQPSYM